MQLLYLVLLLAAAGCMLTASFRRTFKNYNLIAVGLFFWVLVPLIATAKSLA